MKLISKEEKAPIQFSITEILLIIISVMLILYFGKTLFIPLCFSLQISFVLYPICKWLEGKGLKKGFAISLSILLLGTLFFALLYLLGFQVLEFISEWNVIKSKLLETLSEFNNYLTTEFGFSKELQLNYIKNALENSGSQVFPFLQGLAYSLSESLFFLLMIPIFTSLILYHRQLFVSVLYQAFSEQKKEIIHKIIMDTIVEYYKFIKGMLLVYLIVGVLNSLGLFILGIPHPILFGFLASILTFIPYAGIIISSLLPITISWITFNSIWYPVGVILIFLFVQLLEAYIIFPFAVGNRLKINTLAILITITIGGILWGAAGMILFIPMVSILKLIADQTDGLKIISILLGDGNSKDKIS